jgi:TolB-like protein
VLPFENLSADADNAFFANGIQDEILTGLAKIAGLKVISRTSTLRYQSRPPNLSEIARELGVANILEGSVQKAGNRVRVNVQLIEARSDSHLWAETYDRDLKDIFAVQSEIAQKIAESLQTTLTRDERASLSIRPTRNTDAYESYLRARSLILETSSYDRVTVDRGIDALETAVALDPQFALAWAELAQQHVWAYFSGFEPTSEHFARATTALERAESLGPTLPQVAMARGFYLYYALHDFPAALAVVRKAQRGLPNDARAWYVSALLGRRLGQWENSEADFQRARELSPNDYSVTSELGLTLFVQRRYADAVPMLDAALALQPDDPTMLHTKLQCLWSLEGLAGGARMLDEIKSDSPIVLALRGTQAWYQRDAARAAELLRQAVATDAEGTVLPNYLAGYVPARIEWELLLASVEQHDDPAAAGKRYRGLLAMADAGLARPSTPYVEAAWRVVRGWSLSALGRRAEAADEGRRAVASVPASGDALEGPVWEDYLARIHAMNGDPAQAVPLISQQLRKKGSLITPMLLRVDPIWDRIRTDPGFKALAGAQQ